MGSLKVFTPVILTVGLIFVGCGDQFLPEPLKGASLRSRQAVNQAFINLFPDRDRKTDPYGRTREAIDELKNPDQKDKDQ